MKVAPIHLPQSLLIALKNMQPDTHPVVPIDPLLPFLAQVQVPIPPAHWNTDWIVSMEDDIKWLSDKFMADVGDYLWVRESHRLHLVGTKVVCEYADLERREVPVEQCEVRFDGRRMAPLCMFKRAARFVLKIHGIDTAWANPEKTQLNWILDVSRVGDVAPLLGDESK